MKTYNWIVLGALLFFSNTIILKAQDVNIMIPAENIFNHTEFTTVQTVMNTQGNTKWKPSGINASVRSIGMEYFSHTSLLDVYLPTSVLHWQLKSIGGVLAPFRKQEVLPNFKWFTSSSQNWYEPHSTAGFFSSGSINFTFKIPANQLEMYTYHAGNYSIQITHNYGSTSFHSVKFSPDSFYTILSIPKAISWLTANHTVYTEINTLNEYRDGSSEKQVNLGTFEVGNTVDFNLFAKSFSSNIQYTSSNGEQGTRDISLLKLGGNHPNINTISLSPTESNLSQGQGFSVVNGNRNDFQLNISLTQADFKNYFFKAGTYKFEVDLKAKSTDNSIAAVQNIDFTLNVKPLSEIKVPNLGNVVKFQFDSAEKYQNGQSKVIPNQLRISNNEVHELYVKSDAAYFSKEGIQSDVPASILHIDVEGGSSAAVLSTTPQKILDNEQPVLDKTLDMEYSISEDAAQTLVVKDKGKYSINVIYSFTAL